MLVNPQTSGMLVQRHAVAQHSRKIYCHYENFIQTEYFDQTDYVAFTQDAWTSPNHHGFLGITAHFITKEWKLMDVVIGMPQIEGKFFFLLSHLRSYPAFFPPFNAELKALSV